MTLNQEISSGGDKHTMSLIESIHRKEARIRDFVLGLGPRDQEAFYRIFKGMVSGNFSWPSRTLGFARLGILAARNPGLTRKSFFK